MATNPLFQKRHYEALADLIAREARRTYGESSGKPTDYIRIEDLITLLEEDNPGFKRKVFTTFIQRKVELQTSGAHILALVREERRTNGNM